MNKATKIWLLVAAALILAGASIFAVTMMSIEWDWARLSTTAYETNSYEVGEEFDGIIIDTDTADITFLPSDDGAFRVVCRERVNEKHSVQVIDGQLTIKLQPLENWYDYITIMSFESPKVTVYMPRGEYEELYIRESTGDIDIPIDFNFESIDIKASTGDIKCRASVASLARIVTSTGDICVEDISMGELELDVSTGKITASDVACVGNIKLGVSTGKSQLTNITCGSFETSGDTGDITLTGVVASARMSIERSTGDVRFEGCDADEIYVKTSTGDVTGTLLSAKVFYAHSETGREDVPDSHDMTSGICEISCSTGDIVIRIGD